MIILIFYNKYACTQSGLQGAESFEKGVTLEQVTKIVIASVEPVSHTHLVLHCSSDPRKHK